MNEIEKLDRILPEGHGKRMLKWINQGKKEMQKEIKLATESYSYKPTGRDLHKLEFALKRLWPRIKKVMEQQKGIFSKDDLLDRKENYQKQIDRDFDVIQRFNVFIRVDDEKAKGIIHEIKGNSHIIKNEKFYTFDKELIKSLYPEFFKD